MAPDRAAGTGLAATVNGTDALPWPSRAPAIETQPLSVVTLQVQSRVVLTLRVPAPPSAGNAAVELVTLTWQRSTPVGAVAATEVSLELQATEREIAATPMSRVAP